MTAPTPGTLAQQNASSRVSPSNGPVGDAHLDEVVSRVRTSVDALVSTEVPSGSTASDDANTSQKSPVKDAGDVVTRAHEAHEALTDRLRQAQA